MIISQENAIFTNDMGTYVKPYEGEKTFRPEELAEFLRNVKAGEFGWLAMPYSDQYTGSVHFKCRVDGQPRFTDGRFTESDIAIVRRICGDSAAEILLADHLN